MHSSRLFGATSFHFCVLLLLLISLPGSFSVCISCYGLAQGCPGDGSPCPWATGVAANIAAITAAVGGALSVSKLLPPKFARLFPRAVLDGVSALVVRSKGGSATFDVTLISQVLRFLRLLLLGPFLKRMPFWLSMN